MRMTARKKQMFNVDDLFFRFITDSLILTLSLSETPSVKLMVNSSTLGTFSLFFSVWYSVRVFTTTSRRERKTVRAVKYGGTLQGNVD